MPKTRSRARADKQNELKEPYLRLVRRSRQDKGVTEVYVEAISPFRGKAPARVYVGTERSATPERVEAAKIKAMGKRQKLLVAKVADVPHPSNVDDT